MSVAGGGSKKEVALVRRSEGLTDKERRFCELYLLRYNGTQAYRDAGFAAKNDAVAASGAWRLLRKVDVAAYLLELTAAVGQRNAISLDEVVLELRRILTTDIGVAVTELGAVKPLHEWPVDLRRALSSIEIEEQFIDSAVVGEPKVKIGRVVKMKFWSKTEAGQQLMRHLGGFLEDNKQVAASYAELVMGSMGVAAEQK